MFPAVEIRVARQTTTVRHSTGHPRLTDNPSEPAPGECPAPRTWGPGRKPPPSDSGLVVKAIHEHPGVAMTNSVCNSCPDSTRPPGPATDRYRDHRTFEQVVGSELVRFHAVGRVERRGATGVRRAGFCGELNGHPAWRHNVASSISRRERRRSSNGLMGSLPRPPSRQDGARQNLAVACEPDRSYAPHIEEGELAAPICCPVAFAFRRWGGQVRSRRTSGAPVERVAWRGRRRCRPGALCPHSVGNLAGDRCRPCLRRGREIPTLPQRIVILAIINREDEGVTSQPGYTLSKPSNCPNNRDHFSPRALTYIPSPI